MKLETAEDVKAALKICDENYNEANKNLAFKCIERAKWLKDPSLEFDARHEFISQAFFLNHDEESIPMFAKQLHYIDHNDPSFLQQLSTLWAYKWVISALDEFSGISLEKIENLFADFERRFNESGRAGNAVKDFKSRLAYGLGKPDEALEIYRQMMNEDKSGLLDDCKACQVNNKLGLLMYHGLTDEVKKMVQPILDGELTCENVPKTTYPKLTYMYYTLGEWDMAEKCDSQIKKHLDSEHFYADSYKNVLPFWGVTKKYVRALEVIKHQMNFMTPRVSAATKCSFFRSCSLFFRAMHQQGDEWVKLDPSRLEEHHLLEYDKDGQLSTASLEKVFLQMARQRAEKLDTRNRNSFYTDRIKTHTEMLDRQLKAYLAR